MPRPVRDNYSIPWGAHFGAPRAGGARSHNGTDYHAPEWTPIYGVADGGRVAHIGYNPDAWLGLGHNITIVYPGGVQTLDGHMVARTPLQYGQTVNADTIIGYIGQTGNAVNASPPGTHTHHERRHHGVLVDPESVYRNEPAGGDITPIEKGPLMALSDKEQAELLNKTRAVYDAMFQTTKTSRGTRAGVLGTLKAIDDALFKRDETSFGTPAGVLGTLRKVTDKLGITTEN